MEDNDELIETDILFDKIISYNIHSGIKSEIMTDVKQLIEDKNKKITELENELILLKKSQEHLQM